MTRLRLSRKILRIPFLFKILFYCAHGHAKFPLTKLEKVSLNSSQHLRSHPQDYKFFLPITHHALENEPETSSFWHVTRNKVKSQFFSEVMSPSLASSDGKTPQIPKNDFSAYSPSYSFAYIALDYEIAKDWSLLYFQRSFATLTPSLNGTPASFTLLNPRFGMRKANVYGSTSWIGTYDGYLQIPTTQFSIQGGIFLELGLRTSTAWIPKNSRFSFGLLQELTFPLYRSSFSRLAGLLFSSWWATWMNYSLSPKWSTQHVITFPIKLSGGKGSSFSWDQYGGPIIQNGLGYSWTQNFSTSLLLNNHLTILPQLTNTWMSLWVSLKIL